MTIKLYNAAVRNAVRRAGRQRLPPAASPRAACLAVPRTAAGR